MTPAQRAIRAAWLVANKERIAEYNREYRERNRESIQEREKDYRTSHSLERLQWANQYKKLHPEKHSAHCRVHYLVKMGLLEKMPCEVCGASRVEAHHDDYSRPEHVRWLCKKHHTELRKIR